MPCVAAVVVVLVLSDDQYCWFLVSSRLANATTLDVVRPKSIRSIFNKRSLFRVVLPWPNKKTVLFHTVPAKNIEHGTCVRQQQLMEYAQHTDE